MNQSFYNAQIVGSHLVNSACTLQSELGIRHVYQIITFLSGYYHSIIGIGTMYMHIVHVYTLYHCTYFALAFCVGLFFTSVGFHLSCTNTCNDIHVYMYMHIKYMYTCTLYMYITCV